jgi:hypothetical protein
MAGYTYHSSQQPCQMNMEHWWNHDWPGKIIVQRYKPVLVPLTTTYNTFTELEMNPLLHSQKPVSKHLSYDGASFIYKPINMSQLMK